jgi:hypothetical protein
MLLYRTLTKRRVSAFHTVSPRIFGAKLESEVRVSAAFIIPLFCLWQYGVKRKFHKDIKQKQNVFATHISREAFGASAKTETDTSVFSFYRRY